VRRYARRLLIGGGIALLALIVAVGGLTAAWLAGVRVPLASGQTYMKIVALESGRAAGEPENGTIYIALIGSDFRPGVGGARGDALHLLGINVDERKGTILDFPRDICYGGGKINAVHGTGGPRGQADALGQLAGVPVAYAMSVDFAGFTSLVDGVGGVTVNVLQPMNDHNSGAVFSPGPTHMSGAQALAFSRDRYDFPSGDLQRTTNQGWLILDAMRQLRAQMDSPAGKFRLMSLLLRHAQLDGLNVDNVFELGEVAFKVDPDQVRNLPVPTTGGGCSGGLSLHSGAASVFADFADDAILQSH
jgi:LCP family protein required for cell wall assembly